MQVIKNKVLRLIDLNKLAAGTLEIINLIFYGEING